MINTLRKPKFLGIAIFDLVGSFVSTGIVGKYFIPQGNNGLILGGLLSVPLSVAIHVLADVSTPLTDFVTSGNIHLLHAGIIGTGSGFISRIAGNSNMTNFNVALFSSILSAMYMSEYGHGLPKYVRKKLFKLYMMYSRM